LETISANVAKAEKSNRDGLWGVIPKDRLKWKISSKAFKDCRDDKLERMFND